VLWLSSGKAYRTTYDLYQTYMTESVAGLNQNAPVRYRGVVVGRVQKIALAPGNVEQVQVTLAIERGTPVKTDTVAVLQTQGLTGIAYVELTAGRKTSAPLTARPGEAYPVIRSGPSLLTRLDTSVTTLLGSLTRASDNFNALMDEGNRRAIRQTLADLEVLSRTLAARSSAIDSGLANAARTMDNAARLTEAFDRMADAVARAGTSASGTLDGARPDVQRFTGETLPEVHLLVAELRDLTGTLRRLGGELERNPSMVLYGKAPARRGPGE
jgi:phospholipid/cholesterol/gamma-HCH transport system substrate-binding protein